MFVDVLIDHAGHVVEDGLVNGLPYRTVQMRAQLSTDVVRPCGLHTSGVTGYYPY